MATIGWRFPPLSGGTRQGYTNNDIEVFKGTELMDNLAREICQNSLDAHDEESSNPVRLKFELKMIDKNKYDVFGQYEQCLKGCREYWQDDMDTRLENFLSRAETAISNNQIPILIASDYGTKGCFGSRDQKIKTPWEALTGSDGVSVKTQDNSAGSFGIGKNAPFACSSLSMVFYNTVSEDTDGAFVGVSRLATLLDDKKEPTQRVGKYQINDINKWSPITRKDVSPFRDLFLRTEIGTDVIIAGFNQINEWYESVTKAVLKNFFVAIIEKKLEVELVDDNRRRMINSDNITELFLAYKGDAGMLVATHLFETFINPDFKVPITIFENDDVEIYVKSDKSFKKTIANFRSTGMMVGLYSKRLLPQYAAVVVVRGEKLGKLLKDTEPTRHNRWDYKQIDNLEKEKRKEAKKAIEDIENRLSGIIKEKFDIVIEQAYDPVGVGDYLPDTFDGNDSNVDGEDILKAKVAIGKISVRKTQEGTLETDGKKGVGKVEAGNINNKRVTPDPYPEPKPIPQPVVPSDDPQEQVEGVVKGKGGKKITSVNTTTQRAFPLNFEQGLYRVLFKPEKTCKNLYIECFAVGEDERAETLEMLTCNYGGKAVSVKGGKAGPISVGSNVMTELVVKFKRNEKMLLNMRLTEG